MAEKSTFWIVEKGILISCTSIWKLIYHMLKFRHCVTMVTKSSFAAFSQKLSCEVNFYLINVLFGACVGWLPSFRMIVGLVVGKLLMKMLILVIFDENWQKVVKMRFRAFSRKKLSSTSANPKIMKISTIMDHSTSILR